MMEGNENEEQCKQSATFKKLEKILKKETKTVVKTTTVETEDFNIRELFEEGTDDGSRRKEDADGTENRNGEQADIAGNEDTSRVNLKACHCKNEKIFVLGDPNQVSQRMEMENKTLKEQNTALKERIEMMENEFENLRRQHAVFEEKIRKLEEEKENLQEINEGLHESVSNLSIASDYYLEQYKKEEASVTNLEDTIKEILEGNDRGRENNTNNVSERTDNDLVRQNERLQSYSSSLEEKVREMSEGMQEHNNKVYQFEEIIEGLKISESAHEDTVKALLKASENYQENEASLSLRIQELLEERKRLEELIENTENTVKMMMEENEKYQQNETAFKETVRKLTEDIERERDSHLCIICMNGGAQMVFNPCHHMVVCSNCSTSLLTCPLCRQDIDEQFQVYKQ